MFVNSTSHSDVTLSGRPTLGPYESCPDVEKTLHRHRVQIGRYNDVLRRPGRKCDVLWTNLAEWEYRKDHV